MFTIPQNWGVTRPTFPTIFPESCARLIHLPKRGPEDVYSRCPSPKAPATDRARFRCFSCRPPSARLGSLGPSSRSNPRAQIPRRIAGVSDPAMDCQRLACNSGTSRGGRPRRDHRVAIFKPDHTVARPKSAISHAQVTLTSEFGKRKPQAGFCQVD